MSFITMDPTKFLSFGFLDLVVIRLSHSGPPFRCDLRPTKPSSRRAQKHCWVLGLGGGDAWGGRKGSRKERCIGGRSRGDPKPTVSKLRQIHGAINGGELGDIRVERGMSWWSSGMNIASTGVE
jgi:hypothetical protein